MPDDQRITVTRPTDSAWQLAPISVRASKTVAAAGATGHTGSMDTEATQQERVQMVLERVREVWPDEAAEEWMHGCDDVLEGARPVDLARLGRTGEVLVAREVARV